jgi:hypothetical protein
MTRDTLVIDRFRLIALLKDAVAEIVALPAFDAVGQMLANKESVF